MELAPLTREPGPVRPPGQAQVRPELRATPASTRAWLLTGRPGVGKTTCLREVLRRLRLPAGGFVTEELREGGVRVGFVLVTLEGQRAVLARVGGSGGPRVGRYTVDIAALERVGIPAIRAALSRRELVVIDEIGKMEMTSEAFRRAVEEVMASGVGLLGTILRTAHPWADRLKRRPDVELIEVTPGTRERLPEEVAARIAQHLAAARA